MARDADNVNIWRDAWIYVSADATRPALPTDIDAAMPAGFLDVGLLNGDDGIAEERSNSETKAYGWGAGLIKKSFKDFEVGGTFSILEDNEVTRAIIFPGSTATKIVMPKPVYRWLAFETQSDVEAAERQFTTKLAQLWVPNNNRNEADITKWEVQYSLFANGANELFDRQVTA